MDMDEPLDSDTSATEEVYENMRRIVSRITPDRLNPLIYEVLGLPINNQARLDGCAGILFEKAIGEPRFVKEYAEMARRLSNLRVQCNPESTDMVSFRKLLLNRCQNEFEMDEEHELDIRKRLQEIRETPTEQKRKLLVKAKKEAIMNFRQRSLGNIRFIGELYNLKMLTKEIMHDCIKKLLSTHNQHNLELLCNLLRTIGKDLDKPTEKRTVDAYFTTLLSRKKGLLQTQLMIEDLLQLRDNKWIPKPFGNISNTNDQKHREVCVEKLPLRLQFSRKGIERNAAAILDEYYEAEDLKAALTCIGELQPSGTLHVFVSFGINYAVEKEQRNMNLTGTLFNELMNKEILSTQQFEKGLREVLEDADNLAVDFPGFWEHLGLILASTIGSNHRLWNLLRVACDDLTICSKRDYLFRTTITEISIKLGSDKTCDALRKSGLRWSSYVSEGLFSYARQHGLEHLDPVREELTALMKLHSDNKPLFEWIQKNVSESESESKEFLRALVTAVCFCALTEVTASDDETSDSFTWHAKCSVNEDQVLLRTPLLQRYLGHTPDRQLQALYALQALMHTLKHPRNCLQTFFDILYDKEIIVEKVFWDWKDSSDPAEQTGRCVAVQSVRSFFNWLTIS